jgi:ComF family protein
VIAALPAWLHPWKAAAVDLLFPPQEVPEDLPVLEKPFCDVCGESFAGEMEDPFLCSNCLGRRWFVRRARAAFRAEGCVREAIHGFKYNGQFYQLGLLADWLETGYRRFYAQQPPAALVPVPLYPLRRRERGFNQALELARELGKRTGVPVWDCLVRQRMTRTQARLRRSERLRNLRGAFSLSPKAGKRGFDAKGKRLLVLDDVFTTGATVNACAQVLRRAGAMEVCALTVARG